jgi:GMP synthase (glutamine-hydrolysing)
MASIFKRGTLNVLLADSCYFPYSPAMQHDQVLIIDFGSQVTQLIARRVREMGVYSEVVPFQKADAAFTRMKPKAVILSGGPDSVTREGSPRAPHIVFNSGLPIMAICYGQQTTAVQLGGVVEGGHAAEFGRAEIEIKAHSALFDGLWNVGERHTVWMSHGDRVTQLPAGFTVKATSENAPFAVASDEARRIYTTMFHPEVHKLAKAGFCAGFQAVLIHRLRHCCCMKRWAINSLAFWLTMV